MGSMNTRTCHEHAPTHLLASLQETQRRTESPVGPQAASSIKPKLMKKESLIHVQDLSISHCPFHVAVAVALSHATDFSSVLVSHFDQCLASNAIALSPIYAIYEDLATRLPLAFFFGVSEMVRPMQ